MADSARPIVLTAPEAGVNVELHIDPAAVLQVEFDINSAMVTRAGNDLVFSFENGGKLILIDFIDIIANGQAPEFVLSDGTVVAGDALYASLGDIPLETAAGASAGGGGSTYIYEPGELLGGFDSLLEQGSGGTVGGTGLQGGGGLGALGGGFGGAGAGGFGGGAGPVAVNHAPEVNGSLSFNMDEDGTIILTSSQLLANASDIDGDPLRVINLVADNGTITANRDGTWTFKPDADFNGTVNVRFDVTDGDLSTASGATVNVAPVNDAPVITGTDTGAVTEDVTVAASGTLTAVDADAG
ncbi:cadherin-like domain-containing protein, partial [Desulfovibrio subterraneus]|uniref:cadherin-like domain-containing protein n=1 Tax=Desulfovibrio subterraneus TaxID=2718620 RepID=UPI00157A7D70